MSDRTGRWPTPVRLALAITVVGIAVYVGLDIVVQLLPPHYNPITQAESDLGVGPYGWLMDLNFAVRGTLSLALVYALYRVWPGVDRPRAGLALIGLWGAGAFVLATNPTDVSGPVTVHGAIHDATAALAFLCVALGERWVASSLPSHPPWDRVRSAARPLADLTVAALVVLFVGTLVPRVADHAFGLLERVFLGAALLWMLVVALELWYRAAQLVDGRPPTPIPAP